MMIGLTLTRGALNEHSAGTMVPFLMSGALEGDLAEEYL